MRSKAPDINSSDWKVRLGKSSWTYLPLLQCGFSAVLDWTWIGLGLDLDLDWTWLGPGPGPAADQQRWTSSGGPAALLWINPAAPNLQADQVVDRGWRPADPEAVVQVPGSSKSACALGTPYRDFTN